MTVFSKRCSPLYRKMVGGVRQPKVRNLEKFQNFSYPLCLHFSAGLDPHRSRVTTRPSPLDDSTDALLPRTDGSTTRSPDRQASPPRDSHTRGQSGDRHPAHKSHRRHPPHPPGQDGRTARETHTPSASLSTAFQRTSPTDGTRRTHPGRTAVPPARPTHHQPVSRLPSSAQVPPTAPTITSPSGQQ